MRSKWIWLWLMASAWPAAAQNVPYRVFEPFRFAGAPVLHTGDLPAGAPVMSQDMTFDRYGVLGNDVSNIRPKGPLTAGFTLKAGTPLYQAGVVDGEANWCTVYGERTFPICLCKRNAAWLASQGGDMTTPEHEWTATEPEIDKQPFGGRVVASLTVDRVSRGGARLRLDVRAYPAVGEAHSFGALYFALTPAQPDLWVCANSPGEIVHFDAAAGRLSATAVTTAPDPQLKSLRLDMPVYDGVCAAAYSQLSQ